MPSSPQPFETAWRRARDIDGWLTEDQARALHDEARRVSPGPVVEIGSHLGRSTVVLASSGACVIAIDPFPSGWRYGRPDTEARLRDNLATAGVTGTVDLRVSTSSDALRQHVGDIRLLYVDGKHDYWSCTRDLGWTAHLGRGDRFLVHDAFSSVGVTLALLRHSLTVREHRYLGRVGSLARFEVAPASWVDRARVARELPWFARNLVVKVLLRVHLRRVANLLGHEGDDDPF